jgi:hypothetical protein
MQRHVLALIAVCLIATPGSAGAVIMPNRGIAGVTLEMSRAQVERVLGPPLRVEKRMNDFGPFVNYRYRGLQVGFQGEKRVSGISTTRTGERTRGGIGVGSTEAALVKRIPAVRCETFGDFRTCTLGKANVGERITDFFITKGKVSRVVVAFVID